MMKTEKEAKLQWCPMAGDRPRFGDDAERCIASRCAMWVMDAMPARGFAMPKPGFQNAFSEASAGPKPKNIPESWAFMPAGEWDDLAGWLEPVEEMNSRRTGRCGLIHR
jgi:hypothetical protein